jgi:hypothetical protein
MSESAPPRQLRRWASLRFRTGSDSDRINVLLDVIAIAYCLRRLKPAPESREDVIPGLRSLRSLTRGYYLPSLRDWLTQTSALTLYGVGVITSGAAQQIVGCERRELKCKDEGGRMK